MTAYIYIYMTAYRRLNTTVHDGYEYADDGNRFILLLTFKGRYRAELKQDTVKYFQMYGTTSLPTMTCNARLSETASHFYKSQRPFCQTE